MGLHRQRDDRHLIVKKNELEILELAGHVQFFRSYKEFWPCFLNVGPEEVIRIFARLTSSHRTCRSTWLGRHRPGPGTPSASDLHSDRRWARLKQLNIFRPAGTTQTIPFVNF